jgi:hypothetical protein
MGRTRRLSSSHAIEMHEADRQGGAGAKGARGPATTELGGLLQTAVFVLAAWVYLRLRPGARLQISPCNTYPGLTKPFEPGEPDKHYPTGRRNYLRTALSMSE